MEFTFCSKYSCGLKTGKILLVTEQKNVQKRLGFQHFLVKENLNWSLKSNGKADEFYCSILSELCQV